MAVRPDAPAAIAPRSAAQRHHLAAVGNDGRAGHEAAGVGHQQQQRSIEIALLAETADGDFAS